MDLEQFFSTPFGLFLAFLGMALAGVAALAVYMIPAIVGFLKNNPLKWMFFWINLLMGWTMVVWVITLFAVVVMQGESRPVKSRKTRIAKPESAGRAIPTPRSTSVPAASVPAAPAAGSGVNPDHRLPDSSRSTES